jgi:hypothetical protein
MTDLKTPQERVEDFLHTRKGVYYSPVTLANRLGMKRRAVSAICFKSKIIQKLEDGNLAGTGCHKINLFFV